MDGMVFKRLRRRPWLSLVGLFTCGALCLLLCLLTAYRDRQIAQLAEVRMWGRATCRPPRCATAMKSLRS